MNHQNLYSNALAYRDNIQKSSPFSINELFRFPKFFHWVECNVSDDVNFQMFLAGADDGVALRFFWNGFYEKTTLRLWTYFVKYGGIIIDVGAHTGAYTLAAFSAAPNSKIISFEPHFMNFSRLNMNLRGNGFDPGNAYMLAVGENNELLPFSTSSDFSYLTSGGSIGAKDNSLITEIQVISLDKFIPTDIASEISLVKIDVEGHEFSCLLGMKEIILNSKPVIFFECINKITGNQVSNFLKNLDYIFHVIDDDNGMLYPVNDITPEIDSHGNLQRNKLNRIATHKSYVIPDSIYKF